MTDREASYVLQNTLETARNSQSIVSLETQLNRILV